MTILGMVLLSVVFYQGDKISEKISLEPSDSMEIEMLFKDNDIGYYKILMPDFKGEGVFVQILDKNHNIISDEIVETKMSVGYFDFKDGIHVAKITNLSNDQMNLEVEFGDTNSREMIIPGIITLIGGLIIIITSFIKLRDYRMEQPDANIS
jgi:hypothetical protein